MGEVAGSALAAPQSSRPAVSPAGLLVASCSPATYCHTGVGLPEGQAAEGTVLPGAVWGPDFSCGRGFSGLLWNLSGRTFLRGWGQGGHEPPVALDLAHPDPTFLLWESAGFLCVGPSGGIRTRALIKDRFPPGIWWG